MPVLPYISRRSFDPGISSSGFSHQWSNPSDVFSVLLILGSDVVARALAQIAGSRVTPVAFSFGWVAYAVTAAVNAGGENRLMPAADCACKVINGRNGFVRDNSSWVIGRIVRDFDKWMDDGQSIGPIRSRTKEIINSQWELDRSVEPPPKAGLCVSIYKAQQAQPGHPGYDQLYFGGCVTTTMQLGLAAIPCGLFGDWAILLVTAAGIALSFATGALPQWKREKWAGRRETRKMVVLTRGNGSQHAIVVIGNGKGLDLEDLAASGSMSYSSRLSRWATIIFAIFWILLLITAAGITENTWFLLAIGGIGMLDNILVAGWSRSPKKFGIPLEYVEVIGHRKVMEALYAVESRYPYLGRSLLPTFFPGELRPDEQARWNDFDKLAKQAGEKQTKATETEPKNTVKN